MIKVSYDRTYNTLVIDFIGKIDAVQAERSFLDVKKVLPKQAKGFKLLTDFTLAESMDIEIKEPIERAMDFLNERGVTEILRVIPDPAVDIGFNILSAFHYSQKVAVLTLQSWEEAEAKLRNRGGV